MGRGWGGGGGAGCTEEQVVTRHLFLLQLEGQLEAGQVVVALHAGSARLVEHNLQLLLGPYTVQTLHCVVAQLFRQVPVLFLGTQQRDTITALSGPGTLSGDTAKGHNHYPARSRYSF